MLPANRPNLPARRARQKAASPGLFDSEPAWDAQRVCEAAKLAWPELAWRETYGSVWGERGGFSVCHIACYGGVIHIDVNGKLAKGLGPMWEIKITQRIELKEAPQRMDTAIKEAKTWWSKQ